MFNNTLRWVPSEKRRSFLGFSALLALMLGYMIYSDIADYREDQVKLQSVDEYLEIRGSLIEGLTAGVSSSTPEAPFFRAITEEDIAKIGVLSQNLLMGRDIPPPPASTDPLAPPVTYTPVTTDLDIFVQYAQASHYAQPIGAWVRDGEREAYLLCQVTGGYGGMKTMQDTQPWELGANMILLDAKPEGAEPKITFFDGFFPPNTPDHAIQQTLNDIQRGCLLDYLAIYRPEALIR